VHLARHYWASVNIMISSGASSPDRSPFDRTGAAAGHRTAPRSKRPAVTASVTKPLLASMLTAKADRSGLGEGTACLSPLLALRPHPYKRPSNVAIAMHMSSLVDILRMQPIQKGHP